MAMARPSRNPDNPVYVDDEQLRAHAKQVGNLAERADIAAEAANYVSDLTDGYGDIGRLLVERQMRDANDPTKQAIADAAKALHGIRQKLEANADSFSGADENNKQDIEQEGEAVELPGPLRPNGDRAQRNSAPGA